MRPLRAASICGLLAALSVWREARAAPQVVDVNRDEAAALFGKASAKVKRDQPAPPDNSPADNATPIFHSLSASISDKVEDLQRKVDLLIDQNKKLSKALQFTVDHQETNDADVLNSEIESLNDAMRDEMELLKTVKTEERRSSGGAEAESDGAEEAAGVSAADEFEDTIVGDVKKPRRSWQWPSGWDGVPAVEDRRFAEFRKRSGGVALEAARRAELPAADNGVLLEAQNLHHLLTRSRPLPQLPPPELWRRSARETEVTCTAAALWLSGLCVAPGGSGLQFDESGAALCQRYQLCRFCSGRAGDCDASMLQWASDSCMEAGDVSMEQCGATAVVLRSMLQVVVHYSVFPPQLCSPECASLVFAEAL